MSADVDQHEVRFPDAWVVASDGERWQMDPMGAYGREVEHETLRGGPYNVPDPAWASECFAGCGRVHQWQQKDPADPDALRGWAGMRVLGAVEVPDPGGYCGTCNDVHEAGELPPTWKCECGFRVVPVFKSVTPPPVRIVRSDTVSVDVLITSGSVPTEILGASVEYPDAEGVVHRIALAPVMRPRGDVTMEHGQPLRVTFAGTAPVGD